jgi:hypothetical protein
MFRTARRPSANPTERNLRALAASSVRFSLKNSSTLSSESFARALYRGLIILTAYDCGNAFQSLERSLCANASTREGGGWQRYTNSESVVAPHWHPPRLAAARDYEIS